MEKEVQKIESKERETERKKTERESKTQKKEKWQGKEIITVIESLAAVREGGGGFYHYPVVIEPSSAGKLGNGSS